MAEKTKEMKDVFMTSGLYANETMLRMLDYLKNTLGISDAEDWNFIGYPVISVPKDRYEEALLNGKKFACDQDIGLYWINHYNERRNPIASCDVGYAILPDEKIHGEKLKRYAMRDLWGPFDDRTPKIVLEYLNYMKEFLKVNKIIRTYNYEGSGALILSPLDNGYTDYDEKSALFREFVEKNGYGPFKEIYPMTFTGEVIKKQILEKKKIV